MVSRYCLGRHFVIRVVGFWLLCVVGVPVFGEVWTASPASTPPTITAPSGPKMVMPGETVSCTCTRGSDKDTLGGSACEPGTQYNDEMDSTGNYPEWTASGGSWQDNDYKGTSAVWIAPEATGAYTITAGDNDRPLDIVSPHTGSRNDAVYTSASKTVYVVTITLNGDDDIWWFNGCNAANYYEEGTLTANGVLFFTFTWTVVQGQSKIDFWNNTDTQTITNNNTVSFKSTAGSDTKDDVKVEVTLSGVSGKASKLLTIYTPKSLTHLQAKDVDSVDSTYGYLSEIHYSIQDNLGNTLPYDVELNEKFTDVIVTDFPGMDWRRGPEGGTTWDPSDWWDEIQGEADTYTPTPQNPQSPLGSTKVYHWPGNWYVGSETPGSGVLVKSGVIWQKYRDHARHE